MANVVASANCWREQEDESILLIAPVFRCASPTQACTQASFVKVQTIMKMYALLTLTRRSFFVIPGASQQNNVAAFPSTCAVDGIYCKNVTKKKNKP